MDSTATTRRDGIYSLALRQRLRETSSGLILHASLAADTRDERSMLVEQFEHLRPNDLLVLDRGYPAYWLFSCCWRASNISTFVCHRVFATNSGFVASWSGFVLSSRCSLATGSARILSSISCRWMHSQCAWCVFRSKQARLKFWPRRCWMRHAGPLQTLQHCISNAGASKRRSGISNVACNWSSLAERRQSDSPRVPRLNLVAQSGHHCRAGCVGGTRAGCGHAGAKPDSRYTSGVCIRRSCWKTRHQSTGITKCLLELLADQQTTVMLRTAT